MPFIQVILYPDIATRDAAVAITPTDNTILVTSDPAKVLHVTFEEGAVAYYDEKGTKLRDQDAAAIHLGATPNYDVDPPIWTDQDGHLLQ